MTQAICDITTDEVNVDVVVESQADTMVEVANRAGGMEQVFHDNTLIGNGNSVDLGVNTDIIATKEYVDNKVTVINAEIDANADAIQKTREDYINADSEIHQILNNHASELTTLRGNQASLGDQVAGIEQKIPESASGSNPLITKQQLLDEEMDIRDDLNEMASELQTQITAQAAEIAGKQDELIAGDNIIISGNVISATGAGGGGGIANVIHDTTLIGSGTTASPLGVAKNLSVEELTVGTDEGTLNLSITAGTATIATNNGLDIVAQTKFDTAPTTDDATAWADANPTALVTKQQVVSAISEGGGGASGDFLPLSGGTMTGSIVSHRQADPDRNAFTQLMFGGRFDNGDGTFGKNFGLYAMSLNDGLYIARLKDGSDTTPLTYGFQFNISGRNSNFSPSLGGYFSLGSSFLSWSTIHVRQIAYRSNLIAVPDKAGTMALVEDLENIDALPDQTGNAGKVLMTDGEQASWQEPAGGTKVIFREWEE